MPEHSLLFDADACIGCFACEVACKQEHELPPGENWIRIGKVGPTRIGGRLTMKFTARRCRHCGKPPCREACPAGAISRGADGIVRFSHELCIGCRACIEACPFGAPQYSADKKIVRACNLCRERLIQGLRPSCVHHCPTRALYLATSPP